MERRHLRRCMLISVARWTFLRNIDPVRWQRQLAKYGLIDSWRNGRPISVNHVHVFPHVNPWWRWGFFRLLQFIEFNHVVATRECEIPLFIEIDAASRMATHPFWERDFAPSSAKQFRMIWFSPKWYVMDVALWIHSIYISSGTYRIRRPIYKDIFGAIDK